MSPPRRPPPAVSSADRVLATGILFCAICQESIPSAELESGPARVTPRGRVFCGVCATATPEERIRRREALAEEFADDAPVAVPARPSRAQAKAPAPAVDVRVLELRVGELERAAFRLQARIANLEEQLAALRKPE